MELQSGKRIFVHTPMFSGTGTIREIHANEYIPVDVLLDEGDEDGHRYKRVHYSEVKPIEEKELYLSHTLLNTVSATKLSVSIAEIEEEQLVFDI